ncbi:hypothetical protein [Dactylosporangium salmoneum]|uniref:Uncharacterized protein n=1 Tax=Dactylosporangium salmoneum TaxID=53361 RepID=A0ABN3GUT8_9ACTN
MRIQARAFAARMGRHGVKRAVAGMLKAAVGMVLPAPPGPGWLITATESRRARRPLVFPRAQALRFFARPRLLRFFTAA